MDRALEARVNGRSGGAHGAKLADERWPSLGERTLAAFLLLLCVPVLALVMLAVLVSDGRPVLYRSRRLGRWKRPFDMFKIRTLRRGAHLLTGARLLKKTDGLAIRGGHFLRDTRLDELPQLWNIVRG
ncbi:MAG: sugar transferase, partial [Planctomycetota bacterium]